MENVDISKGNTWNTSDDFDKLGSVKVDSLKEVIREIEEQIRQRELLSKGFEQDAENMKIQIRNFLSDSAPKGEDDSEFARERAELRKKEIEISEMQLNEKVGSWRDIAALRQELRDRTKELQEKTSRAQMFEDILKDS